MDGVLRITTQHGLVCLVAFSFLFFSFLFILSRDLLYVIHSWNEGFLEAPSS